MKNYVMPSIIQMEADELRQLTTEVKETIATGFEARIATKAGRSFGIVDLWNIRRNTKLASSLMRR